jgi:ankyrin repeat protein/spore coat protein CotH
MAKWVACLAALFCLGVAIQSSSAKEMTLDDIFPTDRVIDVQITVSQRDWDTIRYQSRNFMTALGASRQFKPMESPYTYVEANVSIDGVVFPKVGLRKKGFIGSQSNTRPSLKIKLNHVDKEGGIEGLTNLTLNNNKQDTSLVNQFMGYALFNAIGSPAPRCAYAKVTVNGENLGIYSHVETIRKPLLKRAFGNNDGTLYEGTVVDFYENWENSFEHKRGDDTHGRAQINALIDLLADPKATEADIGELVDLESFYRFWATEGLVGFWDGYSGNKNNFFVYLNPEGNKFYFIPWGMDSIFTKMSKLEFMNDARAPISVKTQGLIAYKLFQFESGRQQYAEVLTEILDNHWNTTELLATLDKIAVMVEPHLVPAQRVIEEEWSRGGGSWRQSSKPTFASELEAARDFIRNRKSDIQTEIANGMPVWSKRPDPPFAIPEDGDFMKGFLKSIEDTLVGAVRTGDIEAIKQHIAEGADVNALYFEMPPLTWSATMGQTEAAELLLQHGADINGRNRDRNTALHLAVFLGRAEIAKLLIKNGADVNAKNNDGATPIDLLGVPWEMTQFLSKPLGIKLEQEQVEAGKAEIAKILRVSNPSEGENTFSVEEIWDAASNGNLNMVKRAIANGIDVNMKDPKSGGTMLAAAALMGHMEIVALLLEHGADVNARSKDGGTALHAAAFLGRVETVKLLLDKGADTTLRHKMGSTAIDGAKLNWLLTKGILGTLNIEVDAAEVKAGRAEVVKLISRHK